MEWSLIGIGTGLLLLALAVWKIRLPHWYEILQVNPVRMLRGCLAFILLLFASGLIALAVLAHLGG